ncbi:MAG: hypothetical protein HOV86_27180 [Thermoactinospora sp.]|nr:hypothetical protein [Thermoactinospora sp.]
MYGGSSKLPFTGLPVLVLVAVATALIVGGLLLIRTVRFRRNPEPGGS